MGATGGKGSAEKKHQLRRDNGNEPQRGPDVERRTSAHDQRHPDRSARHGAEGTPSDTPSQKRRLARGTVNAERPTHQQRGQSRPPTDFPPGYSFHADERGAATRGQHGARRDQRQAPRGSQAQRPPRPGRGADAGGADDWTPTPPQGKARGKGAHQNEQPQQETGHRERQPHYGVDRYGADRAGRPRTGNQLDNQQYGKYATQQGAARSHSKRFSEEQTPDYPRPRANPPGQPGHAYSPRRATGERAERGQQSPRQPATRSGQGRGKPIGFGANNGLRHPRGSGADVGFGRQDPARHERANPRAPGFGPGQRAGRKPGAARKGYREQHARPEPSRPEHPEARGSRRPPAGRPGKRAPGFGPGRRPGS